MKYFFFLSTGRRKIEMFKPKQLFVNLDEKIAYIEKDIKGQIVQKLYNLDNANDYERLTVIIPEDGVITVIKKDLYLHFYCRSNLIFGSNSNLTFGTLQLITMSKKRKYNIQCNYKNFVKCITHCFNENYKNKMELGKPSLVYDYEENHEYYY